MYPNIVPRILRLAVVALLAHVGGCASVPAQNLAEIPPGAIVAPASDVQPALRAYSGIWVGKWDETWDTAIIVTNIHPDGAVDLIYRYIEHVGEPYLTNSNIHGTIENGALKFGSIQMQIDAKDPTLAQGTIRTGDGHHRASRFKRVT